MKILRRYIPIFEEHAVDRDLLREGARNLRDYLQSQGYFDADVEFKQQAVINDQATIDYLINTGSRHKLVDIEIERQSLLHPGTPSASACFCRRASLLQFPHGRYSENLLRRDEETIVEPVPVQRLSRREGHAPRGGQLSAARPATWPST